MFSSYRELVFNLLSIRKLSLPRLSRLYLVWCVISVSCHGKVQTSFSSSQKNNHNRNKDSRVQMRDRNKNNNNTTTTKTQTELSKHGLSLVVIIFCHHHLSASIFSCLGLCYEICCKSEKCHFILWCCVS